MRVLLFMSSFFAALALFFTGLLYWVSMSVTVSTSQNIFVFWIGVIVVFSTIAIVSSGAYWYKKRSRELNKERFA